MKPEIQSLLDEVPADFVPKLDPKSEDERLVGTLDDLDPGLRRMVVGVFYFIEQGDSAFAAHEAEHDTPDFVEGGEACSANDAVLTAIQEKAETLAAEVEPLLFEKFKAQGDQLDFRTEGIVITPAEPDPLETVVDSLQARGILVIGPVPSLQE